MADGRQAQQPTTGEIVIMAAGLVMLIFSFLDFSAKQSSWQRPWFPVATLLPLYGVVMAVQIVIVRFANVKLPNRIAGFSWDQFHLALGLMAALMAICWLVTDTGNKNIGLWVEVLGGIALAVGAVMLQRECNTGAVGS
jgi:hypothetical protein